ncbi:hypothetical protein ABEV34_06875 [Methylorubrum rhodesianum]|uniref:hypothetical protein n=1 Tax=Methylorubrum TaxID=2282523 RepID=UPI001616F99F|nr:MULTISPECIES: hypothetical protein [Methylorubrum]MBB5765683.1 hypothetical protein [Methylorubrum rhodesianum]MBI1691546.1 hypothetical protein [Methylorubrum sp. DB1722]
MTLTNAQIEDLPELIRDIVIVDRNVEFLRRGIAKPVVSIEVARLFRSKLNFRRELTEAAAQVWGHRLSGEGPARC